MPNDKTVTTFTPQQRLQLAVACSVFDEGMVLLTGPQVACTENEARAVLEELTKRVRDRLEKNKDFTPFSELLQDTEVLADIAGYQRGYKKGLEDGKI